MYAILLAAALCNFDVFGSSETFDAFGSSDAFDVFGNPVVVEQSRPVGVITAYVWPSGCAACEQMKRDISGYPGLRFEFIATSGDAPVLEWKIRGKKWQQAGWPGLAEFVSIYNGTLGTVQQPEQSPTPIAEVRRVLALLRPQSSETFVDYGCGDGRWLIEASRIYGCRAVGVEIDPVQAENARRTVAAAGLSDRIRIVDGDATLVNVEAQVGVAYLYPDVLERLKPKLLKLNRFATYMHGIDGLSMSQNGDSWIWRKPVPAQMQQQPRYAYYGGQAYTGRVCSNPRCSMCNAIARQLGQY